MKLSFKKVYFMILTLLGSMTLIYVLKNTPFTGYNWEYVSHIFHSGISTDCGHQAVYHDVEIPPFSETDCRWGMCLIPVFYKSNTTARSGNISLKLSRFDLTTSWNIMPRQTLYNCKDNDSSHSIGIMPRRLRYAENIDHLIFEILGRIDSLMKCINQKVDNQVHHSSVTLVVPPFYNQEKVQKYEGFFKALNITDVAFLSSLEKPLCLREAYFPHDIEPVSLESKTFDVFYDYFNITADMCQLTNQFTLLQRQSDERIFRNIGVLLEVIKSSGFPDATVVQFESMSIQEQMQIAYCSKVFMAFQGAGMVWSHFLPKNSILIEVGFELWRNDYYTKKLSLIGRKEIKVFNLNCTPFISDNLWLQYADYYGIQGPLDKSLKERIIYLEQYYNPGRSYGRSIWKHANCTCDSNMMRTVLLKVKSYL